LGLNWKTEWPCRLDQGLDNVTQSLQSINRDMNAGFQVSADLTRNLTREVSTGFQRQLAVSQQILVVNREHLDTSRNILAVNKDQLNVSQDILHTSRLHLDVAEGLKRELSDREGATLRFNSIPP